MYTCIYSNVNETHFNGKVYMMRTLLTVCFIILMIILLCLQTREQFIPCPREDKVVYRQCVEGTVPTINNTCCPSDQYTSGICKSGECTRDSSRWLEMPVCSQSNKGAIITNGIETFSTEPQASNAYNFSMGEYLSISGLNPLSLDGEGLPKTRLKLLPPQT